MARSQHPGVKLVRRSRGDHTDWYGRWRNLQGHWQDVNLLKLGVTTEQDRITWARKKAGELLEEKRRAVLSGSSLTSFGEASRLYLDDCAVRLRSRSLYVYTAELDRFRSWVASSTKREWIQEITAADLWAYRTHLTRVSRKSSTASTHLARLRSALEWWRRAQLVPGLNRDAIMDACEALPRPRPEPAFLRQPEVSALLQACVSYEDVTGAAFVACALTTGMRLGELESLRREQVDLEAEEIRLGTETKTHTGRTIDLSFVPLTRALLEALMEARTPYVFGGAAPVSREVCKRWKRHLQIPGRSWTWQNLRQTCGSFLTNAPGIFGAASAFRSARQLGHGVGVAERHYVGTIRGIGADAKTLTEAMGVTWEIAALVQRVQTESRAMPARDARLSSGEFAKDTA